MTAAFLASGGVTLAVLAAVGFATVALVFHAARSAWPHTPPVEVEQPRGWQVTDRPATGRHSALYDWETGEWE